jgi:hypothetical protein
MFKRVLFAVLLAVLFTIAVILLGAALQGV